MGERGPTSKIAALPTGHWGGNPLISQAQAAVIFGAWIGDETWDAIHEAFGRFAYRLALIDAPRANRNRNDPASYGAMRAKAIKLIKKGHPLTNLGLDREPFIEFMRAATDLAELAELSTRAARERYKADQAAFYARFDWRVMQRQDSESMARALEILEAAEPRSYQPQSRGDAKAELARRIHAIFERENLPTELSTWHDLNESAAEADMTPFERLISALGVHKANSAPAFSAWLRECLKSRS